MTSTGGRYWWSRRGRKATWLKRCSLRSRSRGDELSAASIGYRLSAFTVSRLTTHDSSCRLAVSPSCRLAVSPSCRLAVSPSYVALAAGWGGWARRSAGAVVGLPRGWQTAAAKHLVASGLGSDDELGSCKLACRLSALTREGVIPTHCTVRELALAASRRCWPTDVTRRPDPSRARDDPALPRRCPEFGDKPVVSS